MILSKIGHGKKSIKGKDKLKPLFLKADKNNDNVLNLAEFKIFSALLKDMLT